jgi:hypothetical protein
VEILIRNGRWAYCDQRSALVVDLLIHWNGVELEIGTGTGGEQHSQVNGIPEYEVTLAPV